MGFLIVRFRIEMVLQELGHVVVDILHRMDPVNIVRIFTGLIGEDERVRTFKMGIIHYLKLLLELYIR